MSLIFMDGFDHITSDTDFLNKWGNGDGNGLTSSSTVRMGLGKAIYMNSSAANLIRIVSASEEDDVLIAGFGVYFDSLSIDTSLIYFGSDNTGTDMGTEHVHIRRNSDGTVSAYRGNSGGTVLGTTSSAVMPNQDVWYYIEVKVTLHDTTGAVVVKVDDVEVLNLSAIDTKNGGTDAVFDTVRLERDAVGSTIVRFDDFYLCNEQGTSNNDFLGESKIYTLTPAASGNYSQLTGSDGNSVNNYQQVDEIPPNTSDYNGSATNGQKDTYDFRLSGSEFTTVATTGSVAGIQLGSYAAKDDVSAKSFRHVHYINSTDYTESDHGLATSYTYYYDLIEQNPDTATAWTRSDIDGAEWGFEVRP